MLMNDRKKNGSLSEEWIIDARFAIFSRAALAAEIRAGGEKGNFFDPTGKAETMRASSGRITLYSKRIEH